MTKDHGPMSLIARAVQLTGIMLMLLTSGASAQIRHGLRDDNGRHPSPYFAEVCKAAGYRTGYIGKWHMDGHGRQAFSTKLMDHSNKDIRQWYRGYYAAIEALDDCLGRLYQTLFQQGVLDNTLIVFTSDHGDNLGSHRQYGKQLPYEESISIPFVVRYPPKIPARVKTDALLAPVDMMPTLLSLAGIACPSVDGKDISAAAMGQDADVQDAVLIMRLIWLGTNWITNGSGPWRGVRTKRYTYARKADTGRPWLLFDNEQDPQQLNNLIRDPAHAHVVKKLDAKTNELLATAGDPENPVIIAEQIKQECQAQGVPVREQALFPKRVEPGSGFPD